MAVVNMKSLQLLARRDSTDKYRQYPAENFGKLRSMYAQIGTVPGRTYPDGASPVPMTAGDAGSTIDLLTLPEGRLRLLPYKAVVKTSLSNANIKIGIRQYTTQAQSASGNNTTVIPEDPDAFTGGAGGIALTSAASTAPTPLGTEMDINIFSYRGITLFATITGPVTANDWLEVRFDFLTE